MNLQPIDRAILAALFALLIAAAWLSRKYIKSVADFLVAGRSVGRYLGLGSDSMQAMGAVTIHAEGVSEFDQKFFFIFVYYWMIYSVLSWSPNSMLASSARMKVA